MKKSLLVSYFDGFTDFSKGESYKNLLSYFFPELISVFVLYSLLHLIDARLVANLKSTSIYATLGVTKTLIHFITKVADGIAVGAIILCGQFNGAGDYKKAGKTMSDVFWISIILGLLISSLLYFGAYGIFYFYGVPEKMINIGIPFLRLKAIGIFLSFVYFAFVSFLRGVKNTRIPMYIYAAGAALFVLFDYTLVLGKFGFPAMGLQGSALASVIQYACMVVAGMCAVLWNKEYAIYAISLKPSLNLETIKRLFHLSWPVVLDKSIMAVTYIWLGMMLAPMGKYVLASYTIIADMERISFAPAIAFAQIMTFLASNDYGSGNMDAIKVNIKKSIFLGSIFVLLILTIFCMFPTQFISLFDQKGTFTQFSAKVFPLVSALIFFDLIQIILSGALRGIGQVQLVMWTRFIFCFFVFFPLSYGLSLLPLQSHALKFVLIYGMFYVCNGFMSMVYIYKFRSTPWQPSTTK